MAGVSETFSLLCRRNVPMQNKVMLAVLAHPDDESFGMGGTLAFYARQGVAVHLVCATRGEAGQVDTDYLQNFDSIAARREEELRCAADHLGLAGVHFLGYRDSGMPGSPDNEHPDALVRAAQQEVALKITHHIRVLRPQVVLTFDPIGGYKHPDHIAIHRATVVACDLAGDPSFVSDHPPHRPHKLYFSLIPKKILRFWLSVMRLFRKDPRRYGRNGDIDLQVLVEEGDFPVHARINYRSVVQIRDQAVACHASQGGREMKKNPMGWLRYFLGHREYFMRAFPPPLNGSLETDLFAGID
jgi:LmbE family N-acetylglucosaminyl deacetylase